MAEEFDVSKILQAAGIPSASATTPQPQVAPQPQVQAPVEVKIPEIQAPKPQPQVAPQPQVQFQAFQPQVQAPAFQGQQGTSFQVPSGGTGLMPAIRPVGGPPAPVSSGFSPPSHGMVDLNFGDTLPRFGVERFKGVENETKLIAVILLNVKGIHTHYNEQFNYFYCFRKECCEHNGLPSVRYLLPVIQYDTDKEGNPLSRKFDLKYLLLPEDDYKKLKTIHTVLGRNGQTLDQVDLMVNCSDSQFQKNSYIAAGPAMWRQDQAMAMAVVEAYKELWPKVHLAIAKNIPRAKYLQEYGAGGNVSQTAQLPPGQGYDLNQFQL